jgi:hypothetical protein
MALEDYSIVELQPGFIFAGYADPEKWSAISAFAQVGACRTGINSNRTQNHFFTLFNCKNSAASRIICPRLSGIVTRFVHWQNSCGRIAFGKRNNKARQRLRVMVRRGGPDFTVLTHRLS